MLKDKSYWPASQTRVLWPVQWRIWEAGLSVIGKTNYPEMGGSETVTGCLH